MKKITLPVAFFTLLLSQYLFAQGQLINNLTLLNSQGKPMANTLVSVVETSTKERKVFTTDGAGKTVIKLVGGDEWNVNVLRIKGIRKLQVPKEGTMTGSSLITYDFEDWERKHRAPVDRSKMTFIVEDQSKIDKNKIAPEQCLVEIQIDRADKSPLKNFPVQLTCYKQLKQYKGSTDATGRANFLVPKDAEYEIDIDGIESFEYVDAGPRSLKTGTGFIYEPTALQETVKNDTATQVVKNVTTGTSGRTFTTLQVTCADCELGKEKIYLEDVYSHKVYKSVIDASGKVNLLLPIKRKYLIHFRYQKDVDVVDLSDMRGISQYMLSVFYQPQNELKYPERYIKAPNEKIKAEFRKFIKKQFPDPAPDKKIGLFVNWLNPEVNAQSKEAIMEIGFKIPEQLKDLKCGKLNVCFVIDKSGSMASDERLECVKKAMLNFIPSLRQTDIVSMVAFDHEHKTWMKAQANGDGAYLSDMIGELHEGGGTAIYSGLEEGYKQVLKNFSAGSVNRVILLTDGYDGVPVDSTVKMSKRYNAKGIELSTVGVGESYNEALLAQLATFGGGQMRIGKKGNDMYDIFKEEMNSILRPVAKNVEVEIEYNGQIVYKQLYGYPSTQKKSNVVQMKLDNIFPGLNTLALVHFNLKNPTKEIEKQPVIVRMKYLDLALGTEVLAKEETRLKWKEGSGELELAIERDQKKILALAITNQTIKSLGDSFAKGEFAAVKKSVEDAQRQLKNVFPYADDNDINQLIKDISDYISSLQKVITVQNRTKG